MRKGKLISQRERELTLDLARYVFDQGVIVLCRPRFGKHELDLFETDTQNPMFIEVKAYASSHAKKELIDGIAQFHSYLCNIEAWKIDIALAEKSGRRQQKPIIINENEILQRV